MALADTICMGGIAAPTAIQIAKGIEDKVAAIVATMQLDEAFVAGMEQRESDALAAHVANEGADHAAMIASMSSTAQGYVTTRTNAADPHPQYLTAAEGNAAYSALGHNHSGVYAPVVHTHVIADTTGLQTALDGKAALVHTHAQADVTGLVAALAGKAASVHTHVAADVTDFSTAIQSVLGSLGVKKAVSFTGLTASPTIVTLLGAVYYNLTVTGLLTTDILVEAVPTADLPSNLTQGQPRISAANTLRMQYASGVLYTGTPNIGYQITVLRAA